MSPWKLTYLLAAVTLQAQTVPPPETVPLYSVTVIQSSAKAINYRYMKSSTKIDFKGTVLAPAAKGEAKVSSEAATAEIKAEFEGLGDPGQYGPEYLTYVLWAISPEGRATNLGEVLLHEGKGKLKVTEALQAFGLVVTAEPYFAVTQPSDVVVLENAMRPNTQGKVEFIDAKYDLLKRGHYHLDKGAAAPAAMDKDTPFAVYQARNAVAIAFAAGAKTYATEPFAKAERLLAKSESKEGNKKERMMEAREATQSAEDARVITFKRQDTELRETRRKEAQAKVEAARMETERARVETERAKNETEQAKSDTAQVAASLATVDSARRATQVENTDLKAKLLTQLNAVMETRATTRGLIVNMSGVTFQSGKAVLLPAAREKLAKIAGLIMAHPGLKLESEGYTDNVGGDALNLRLSEQRAAAAQDYLVSQGVPASAIVHRGLGKASPIDSNDNASGRQKNRRVELVVSGAGLTPAS